MVRPAADLDALPVNTLNTLKSQLGADMERVDKVNTAVVCVSSPLPRSLSTVMPCLSCFVSWTTA